MSDERKFESPAMAAARFEAPGFNEVIEVVRKRDAEIAEKAFQAGFQTGWDQAYKKIKELFKSNSETASFDLKTPAISFGDSTVVMKDTAGRPLAPPHHNGRPIGTKDIVRHFIAKSPGLKGVDLVSLINAEGFELHERTIRTALHRLKLADEIMVVDGRWYTPESAPPDPLSHEPEEDNDAAAS